MTIVADPAAPIHVTSEEVAARADVTLAARAAREAATARATGAVITRRVTLPFEGGWMRVMTAAVSSLGVFGYKEFHLAAGNQVRYAVHLFATSDGRPLGIVDAMLITPLRTAATAAYAAGCFFGTGTPVRLAVIGTGAEALAGVRALADVLTVNQVRATSRSAENRCRFVAEVTALGLECEHAATARAATDGADLVYVATNSGGAIVLQLDDLVGVPLVASIGSTMPDQRELDGAILSQARDVVIDTPDVLEESGDAIHAADCGLDRARVSLLGAMPTRTWSRDGGQTVYKSIGSPEQDIVLAHAIVQAAQHDGFGRPITPLSAIKMNL